MTAANDAARFARILGRSFMDEISDHDRYPILRIGKDSWSKTEVAALGIVQTRACRILSKIARDLGAKSAAHLYATTSPYTYAGYPAGVTTMYVLFAVFRDKDLDLDQWYARGQDAAIVSFVRLKKRELEAERRTKADAKRRQRAQRTRTLRSATQHVLSTAAV